MEAAEPCEVMALLCHVKDRAALPGFIHGASGKEPAFQCSKCKRRGFDPWARKISPGGGNGNPFQYCCLENSMDRGAWQAAVHRVTLSQT